MKSPDRIAVGSHERENKSSSNQGWSLRNAPKHSPNCVAPSFPYLSILLTKEARCSLPLPGRHERVRATPRIASSVSAKLIGASWRKSSPAFLAVSVWFAASPVATSLPSRGRVELPKMHLLCLAWPPVTNLYIHAGTNDEPGQEEEEVEEISTHTRSIFFSAKTKIHFAPLALNRQFCVQPLGGCCQDTFSGIAPRASRLAPRAWPRPSMRLAGAWRLKGGFGCTGLMSLQVQRGATRHFRAYILKELGVQDVFKSMC